MGKGKKVATNNGLSKMEPVYLENLGVYVNESEMLDNFNTKKWTYYRLNKIVYGLLENY